MALIFRNTDMGKWGVGKGARLTSTEGDLNTWQLAERIRLLEENPPQANGIANIQVVGSQFKVILDDATEYGPFTMPVASFHYRDAWANDTEYFANDLVTTSTGLYLILLDHVTPVAPATFNPNANTGSPDFDPLYRQQFGIPTADGDEVQPSSYPAIEHAAFGGI